MNPRRALAALALLASLSWVLPEGTLEAAIYGTTEQNGGPS